MTVMKSDPLKAFRQHGFIQTTTSGDTQEVGTCPFCGKEKFFINVNTKAWDCKVCGKSGGYKGFLREIVAHCQEYFKGEVAIALAQDRGIGIPTLQGRGVGYNPVSLKYTVPVPDRTGLDIWNVLTYHLGGKLISTSGSTVGLFGWDQDIDSAETIWLCEGEWDAMAWMETLTALGRGRDIALAIPGAGTFKAEWTGFFMDKVVRILYDHDKAGRDGAIKVYGAIKQMVKDIKFLHWPEDSDLPGGFDIRDLCKQHPEDAETVFAYVKDRLEDMPPGVDLSALLDPSSAPLRVKYTGPGMPAEEVYKAYRKWMYLPDHTVLDFMFGTLIANRLQGDPIWAFIVGPPSCGKSELFMSIADAVGIYFTTSMTPNSLISGATGPGGSDPSLIPKLNGKVLCIKDYTVILNMDSKDRDNICGIFRDSYDGSCKREFGNGVSRGYKSKFGILAGVTQAIEEYMDGQTALGERYLRYPFPIPRRGSEAERLVMQKSRENAAHKDRMQAELVLTGNAVLNFDFGAPPTIPPHIVERIHYCAQFTARLRSVVPRDKYRNEITRAPYTEMAIRLSNQFCKLCEGIGMFRRKKEVGEDEYAIIQSVARATIPSDRDRFLSAIIENGVGRAQTLTEIKEKIRSRGTPSERTCEDLKAIGVVDDRSRPGMRAQIVLDPETLDLIQHARLYQTQEEDHAQ